MFAPQGDNQQKTISLIPSDWMKALSELINPPEDSPYEPLADFDTVDALLGACADDLTAGIMLKRVLKWYESKNGDEFYMSASGWKRQCFVTWPVVKRVQRKNFPLVGVSYEVKSAVKGREAVSHYRIDIMKFMARLADVVGMTIFKLTVRLAGKRRDVTRKSSTTLTIDTTNKTSIKVVEKESSLSEKVNEVISSDIRQIDLLLEAGLYRDVASRFVDLSVDQVQACIDSANEPHVRKRITYLIGALENQLKSMIQEQATNPRRDWSAAFAQPEDIAPEAELEPKPKFSGFSIFQSPKAPEPSQRLHQQMVGNVPVVDVWQQMMSQMALQAPDLHRDLQASVLIDYSDNTYRIWTTSIPKRDWLLRCERNIRRLLADMSGAAMSDVSIEVEAPEESAPFSFLMRKGLES